MYSPTTSIIKNGLRCYCSVRVQVEYHDDSDDELTEKPRSTVENVDVTPETLDALAEAAMRANVSSLGPDLNAPVPMNTPADGNLLDL